MLSNQKEILIRNLEWEKKRKLRPSEREAVGAFIERKPLIAKFLPDVRRLYADIIKDYLSMYKVGSDMDYSIIRDHFKMRFQSLLIYIFNTTAYKFGRKLRTQIGFEKYGYKDIKNDAQDINSRYDATIFNTFSVMADKQSDEIMNTVEEDLQFYTDKAAQDYTTQLSVAIDSLNKINIALAGIMVYNAKMKELVRRQNTLINEIKNLRENKDFVIKMNIKKSLQSRFKSRADLVTEQSVGGAQSVSQQVEAQSIQAQAGAFVGATVAIKPAEYANLLTKEWVSILDRKTRPWHLHADGQIVKVQNAFVVGNERLMMPRDPNGSAKNTMRCRCEAVYSASIR